MKKIGILYICTGEYWKFWSDFYKSTQKYFLKSCELNYFLFTDNEELLKINNKNIFVTFQEKMNWPLPTLLRYKTFYENNNLFKDMDFLIFCNANLLILQDIGFDEIFSDKDMFATLHPGFYNKSVNRFPDESNIKSLAYIKRGISSKYVCGGFNGGRKESFIQMSKEINKNTDIDLKNNIVAIWHDESHLNSYVERNQEIFNFIDSRYCYPENTFLDFEKKILIREKNKWISIKHKGLIYLIRNTFIKYIKLSLNYLKELVN